MSDSTGCVSDSTGSEVAGASGAVVAAGGAAVSLGSKMISVQVGRPLSIAAFTAVKLASPSISRSVAAMENPVSGAVIPSATIPKLPVAPTGLRDLTSVSVKGVSATPQYHPKIAPLDAVPETLGLRFYDQSI